MTHRTRLLFLAVCAALSCNHPPSTSTTRATAAAASPSVAAPATPLHAADPPKMGLSGQHRADAGKESDWVPAEFKQEKARFRDTGVYVDGKPVGFLNFGELPLALSPTWIDEEVSIPFHAGQKGPDFKTVRQRYYRFTDYLRAVGVDVSRVKAIHVYGPRFTESIVASGDDLRRSGKDFLFRFGGEVSGKPVPRVPDHFGNDMSPDKITSVSIYVDKEPPKFVADEGFELDGKVVTDIPYFGEPLRGGVRLYLDDHYATTIKRRLLDEKAAVTVGGAPRWKLLEYLKAQGVDTSKIVEAWIIRDEQRTRKITRAELEGATFEASPQHQGEVVLHLGDESVPANVVAFHTHAVPASKLPQILPSEHFEARSEK